MIENTRLLTLDEVANALRVHRESVRRLILAGELPAFRVGHLWRIRESDLAAYWRGSLNTNSSYGKKRD